MDLRSSSIWLYLIGLSSLFVIGYGRRLSFDMNPNCTICDEKVNVGHVKSIGDNSTYHYLWCFVTGYTPAVLLVETNNAAQLEIDWQSLLNHQESNFIQFKNATVVNAMGVELTKLDVIVEKSAEVLYEVPLKDIVWNMTSETDNNAATVSFQAAEGSNNVEITLAAFDQTGRTTSVPRLLYLDSTNVFSLQVKGLDFNSSSVNSTSNLQLSSSFTVVTGGSQPECKLDKQTSIDDEYSPGVFHRFNYKLNSKNVQTKPISSYVDWKPVAYFDSVKTIDKSIRVEPPTIQNGTHLSKASILVGYFANTPHEARILDKFKFGSSEDSFNYEPKNYIQFSMVFGLNDPPSDGLSTILKIIIFIGVGVPGTLFIIGIIYTVVHKVRNNNYNQMISE